jgi:hypothetical protein
VFGVKPLLRPRAARSGSRTTSGQADAFAGRIWNSVDVNVRTVTAAVYALLAAVFVFTYDSAALDDEALGWTYVGVALLIQPVTGFLIPRLWAFALPFVAFVVSLPISKPVEPEISRITDAGLMLIGGVIAMILMSLGMTCRLTIEAFRDPPEPLARGRYSR